MAQVDLKPKLIHSQAHVHDYKARGSVTLCRGLELGDEEKLSKAGNRLKDYYLTPVFCRTRGPSPLSLTSSSFSSLQLA